MIPAERPSSRPPIPAKHDPRVIIMVLAPDVEGSIPQALIIRILRAVNQYVDKR
jgi:hypothetical protein